mmetsp:Transcript_42532/g.67286  ORF Transcript_42532/g.67286 Transcript_42532/m.67286 type:complete len:228 (+) Transcript_42532:190-873(+)
MPLPCSASASPEDVNGGSGSESSSSSRSSRSRSRTPPARTPSPMPLPKERKKPWRRGRRSGKNRHNSRRSSHAKEYHRQWSKKEWREWNRQHRSSEPSNWRIDTRQEEDVEPQNADVSRAVALRPRLAVPTVARHLQQPLQLGSLRNVEMQPESSSLDALLQTLQATSTADLLQLVQMRNVIRNRVGTPNAAPEQENLVLQAVVAEMRTHQGQASLAMAQMAAQLFR